MATTPWIKMHKPNLSALFAPQVTPVTAMVLILPATVMFIMQHPQQQR